VTFASCIYEGAVRHRRFQPELQFRDRLALVYVDLGELPSLLGGRLVRNSPGLVRFRRADYLGEPAVPLGCAVRDLVEERTGRRPNGPIRLLTQLRSFGHCFNPVSFYYCIDEGSDLIDALVAEVTNTPWGQRHAYVIPGGSGQFDKALHVSPFMAMDHSYSCRASAPAETLAVHVESCRAGARAFDATLSLRRRELTTATLRRVMIRYPLATVRLLALIYARALRLRVAGAPVYPHPDRAAP
jgi:uncharacterized protein